MKNLLLTHLVVRRWILSMLSLSIAGALFVLLVVCLAWPAGVVVTAAGADSPTVHYVAPGGDCGAASPCYDNVQAALDSALPGEEIRLAAGIYGGVQSRESITQVVYLTKTLTLRGGFTPQDWQRAEPEVNRSVLDARGLGRVIVISGTISPTLEGLWITGGNATGLGGHEIVDAILGYDLPSGDAGGGIYIASATPIISNCVIYSNTASTTGDGLGGGVYARQSLDDRIRLARNQIISNGAGISNTSAGGGILTVESNAMLDGNTVASNAQEGVFLVRGQVTVTGNTVRDNGMQGVHLRASSGIVSGNWLLRNADSGLLAEAKVVFEDPGTPSVDLINNVVAANSGDGIKLAGDYMVKYVRNFRARLIYNTIADNHGVGLEVQGPADVSAINNVISGQSIGMTANTPLLARHLIIAQYTLWYPAYTVVDPRPDLPMISTTADITGTPSFVRPAVLNYHIAADSAAIGQATTTDITTDIDGEARPQGGSADIGADEYTPAYGILRIVYLPVLIREK